jgi:surfeit locus 1 family protein
MPAGYSFRPRAWAAILAALACAGGIALGNWQAGRAEHKRSLAEQQAQGAVIEITPKNDASYINRRVAAAGEFVPDYTVLLDNKLRQGRAGYEVLTPLKLAGSSAHVLVNRGWVAALPSREQLPQLRTPAGQVRIEGIALARLPRALALGKAQGGRLRQNLEVEQFAAETGIALLPVVLQQHAGPEDGLAREWPHADAGADMHASYALQWYSLAGLSLVLFVVLSFRRVAES